MYQISFSDSIDKIPASTWNKLCNTDYPFIQHAFLKAMEDSGSVTAKTGWQPMHMTLVRQGETVGVMPLYIKNHSYGEYVFDWSWADAWARQGLDYYPKLVTAIPYTPAQGPRMGTSLPEVEALNLFYAGIRQLAEQMGASSWHGLFLNDALKAAATTLLSQPQCAARMGLQYHWFNRDYQDFDHYLSHFNSRKRKNLRKERQKVTQQGIVHRWVKGSEVSKEELEHFWIFYQMTHLKRGRRGYLTRSFFEQLTQSLGDQLLFCFACHQDTMVAGSLFFKDSQTLYGRYWGSTKEYDSLHFETCYYQGIEYAIKEGLQRFDPGAQGEHKIARGFEPIPTWSVHHIEDLGFAQAVKSFVEEEATQLKRFQLELREGLPFRQEEMAKHHENNKT